MINVPITNILKELRSKQKTRSAQKAIEERIAMKTTCTLCNETIVDAKNSFKEMENNIEIVREMRRSGGYMTRMIGGTNYTIDDVEAKINRGRCWVQYHLDRYQRCCKEGKLPEIEKFKC